jgi:RNase P subunit RPR2
MVSFACPDARARKERPMTKKTCACCDYPLEPNSTIKVKIGGKDVEVCCEECATKLREASARQKKKA